MTSALLSQVSTVIAHPISNDYRIDVLLENGSNRWNRDLPVGSPIEVTYSFMSAAPAYAEGEAGNGFSAFTESQMAAVRQILSQISQQVLISFREVSDSEASYGQIRFGNNRQDPGSAGYAFMPDSAIGDNQGDVYINVDDPLNLKNVVAGTIAYATLVHEIGHALGLKHPGNYNGSDGPSTAPGNYLAAAEDTEANTVMSYTGVVQGQQREFFGKFDMLALQYLYGKREHNTGTSTYSYDDIVGERQVLINDNGGTDTINASGLGVAASINLRDGAFSSLGRALSGGAAQNNLSIAYGTVIENVVGTSLADIVIGNASNNAIDGATGTDTFVLAGARSNFTVAITQAGVTVTDKTGAEGTDVLTNVERIKFADSAIALDTDGVAGQAYRLYQAAFDRKPDAGGLGYWIAYLENGASLQHAATGFFNSAEFKGLYGVSPTTAELISRFYANVLHREAVPSELEWWSAELASGRQTPTIALANFSASPENQAQVIGTIQNGMEYVPYV